MNCLTSWYLPQRRLMPDYLASWLTDSGSLTMRLKSHHQNDFSVQVLGHQWAKPLIDECHLLSMRTSVLAYQREVYLMDGDAATVYARTIVPRATFNAMQYRFKRLGNQSLGEILFTDPAVWRAPIEIARLRPGQWLYNRALLQATHRPPALWGRRSAFYLSDRKLLISEIFLPALTGEACDIS